GLTLWLLWNQQARTRQQAAGSEEDGPLAPRTTRYLLLVGFVLWVNTDEWFFLGPLLVALFWLGERLGGERRTPGWLIPVSLAACLVNPHTVHAFTVPQDLALVSWTSGLRQDARFQGQFASPWPEFLRAA